MLLALASFAAALGLIAILFAINQKRSKALAAWASSHGGQHGARDLHFGEGSSRAARDVLTGVARGMVGPMLYPSTEPVVQTGDAVFDLKFKVFSEDPDFARRLLDPHLRQMLVESDAPGFVIAGSDIGIASDGGTNPDGVLPTFDYLARLMTYRQKKELPAG